MNTIVNSEPFATQSGATEAAPLAEDRRSPELRPACEALPLDGARHLRPVSLALPRGFSSLSLWSARRAVVLGDGDGRFTAELLRVNSQVQIDAVDASPAMLRALLHRARPECRPSLGSLRRRPQLAARKSALRPRRVSFFPRLPHDRRGSALWLLKLHDAVSPSAMWIVSEFAVPSSWFGRLVARPLVWLLYRAFGLLTGLKDSQPARPSCRLAQRGIYPHPTPMLAVRTAGERDVALSKRRSGGVELR